MYSAAPGGSESRLPFPLPGTGGRAQACGEADKSHTQGKRHISPISKTNPENHQEGARELNPLTSLSSVPQRHATTPSWLKATRKGRAREPGDVVHTGTQQSQGGWIWGAKARYPACTTIERNFRSPQSRQSCHLKVLPSNSSISPGVEINCFKV